MDDDDCDSRSLKSEELGDLEQAKNKDLEDQWVQKQVQKHQSTF